MSSYSSISSIPKRMGEQRLPLRVNCFRNGSTSGKRCVLDRSEPLDLNLSRIARRLGLYQFSNPVLYTSAGIRVESLSEIIEGEDLYFEPNDKPYKPVKQAQTSLNSSGLGSDTFSSQYSSSDILRRSSIDYDFEFKFILVGNTAVGKSCLLIQFSDGRFQNLHEATICVDFGSEIIDINGKSIKCKIWDTAGQEDFLSITRAYYRETAAAFLVYDITDRDSFDQIKVWLDRVRENTSNREISLCLIANKLDLDSKRVVSTEEGESFARTNQMLYIETSAKTGTNVRAAFEQTAEAILRKIDQGLINVDDPSQGIKQAFSAANEANTVTSIVDDKTPPITLERTNDTVVTQQSHASNSNQGGGVSESCCF